MNKYTTYCTEAQTKKALKLGAPIFTFSESFADDCRTSIYDKYCSIPPIKEEDYEDEIYADIPTAEQMIGFLRSKGIKFYFNDLTALWQVVYDKNIIGQGCSDNKELKAIDAALEYLTNKKK